MATLDVAGRTRQCRAQLPSCYSKKILLYVRRRTQRADCVSKEGNWRKKPSSCSLRGDVAGAGDGRLSRFATYGSVECGWRARRDEMDDSPTALTVSYCVPYSVHSKREWIASRAQGGPIALQYGGGVVKFRKVEIRPL